MTKKTELQREKALLRRVGGESAITAYNELRIAMLDPHKGSCMEFMVKISQLMEIHGIVSVGAAIKLIAGQDLSMKELISTSTPTSRCS